MAVWKALLFIVWQSLFPVNKIPLHNNLWAYAIDH